MLMLFKRPTNQPRESKMNDNEKKKQQKINRIWCARFLHLFIYMITLTQNDKLTSDMCRLRVNININNNNINSAIIIFLRIRFQCKRIIGTYCIRMELIKAIIKCNRCTNIYLLLLIEDHGKNTHRIEIEEFREIRSHHLSMNDSGSKKKKENLKNGSCEQITCVCVCVSLPTILSILLCNRKGNNILRIHSWKS